MKYSSCNSTSAQEEYIEREVNIPILYTVREASELLKTNVDYVHKLRKAGLLPFLKLGQYKVLRSTLIGFLKQYEGQDLTDPFHVKELDNGKD